MRFAGTLIVVCIFTIGLICCIASIGIFGYNAWNYLSLAHVEWQGQTTSATIVAIDPCANDFAGRLEAYVLTYSDGNGQKHTLVESGCRLTNHRHQAGEVVLFHYDPQAPYQGATQDELDAYHANFRLSGTVFVVAVTLFLIVVLAGVIYGVINRRPQAAPPPAPPVDLFASSPVVVSITPEKTNRRSTQLLTSEQRKQGRQSIGRGLIMVAQLGAIIPGLALLWLAGGLVILDATSATEQHIADHGTLIQGTVQDDPDCNATFQNFWIDDDSIDGTQLTVQLATPQGQTTAATDTVCSDFHLPAYHDANRPIMVVFSADTPGRMLATNDAARIEHLDAVTHQRIPIYSVLALICCAIFVRQSIALRQRSSK